MKTVLIIALSLTAIMSERPKQGISCTITVYNWRASLLTSENRYVVDIVQAEDYSSAVNAIRRRYPNCTIYSITKVN